MPTLYELVALLATVGSGLTAGLCFAFAAFVMRALDRLDAPQAIRAMQAVNQAILRSSAMVVWFGTAVLGVVAAALAAERTPAVVAVVLYVAGAVLITGGANVPRNEALDRVDPDAPEAAAAWRRYRVQWGRWNLLRTAVLVLATAGFALAR